MFVMMNAMKYWRLYFQGNNYIMMNCFLKNKLKVVMMRVNLIKIKFPYDILYLLNN